MYCRLFSFVMLFKSVFSSFKSLLSIYTCKLLIKLRNVFKQLEKRNRNKRACLFHAFPLRKTSFFHGGNMILPPLFWLKKLGHVLLLKTENNIQPVFKPSLNHITRV